MVQVHNVECAIKCYEAAVAAKPDFWLSLNNLGVIFTTQGQSTRGRRHLRAAIAAQPDYAEAHNNLGVLLRDMGNVEDVRNACSLRAPVGQRRSALLCTTLRCVPSGRNPANMHLSVLAKQTTRGQSRVIAGDCIVRGLHAPVPQQRQCLAEPPAGPELHPPR